MDQQNMREQIFMAMFLFLSLAHTVHYNVQVENLKKLMLINEQYEKPGYRLITKLCEKQE